MAAGITEIQDGQSGMFLQRLTKDAPVIIADGMVIPVQIQQTPVVV
jgi:hypothetical protein